MSELSHRRHFTIWHAALFLPWVIAAYGFARTFNDNSYLWHVRAGDLQLERGSVLTTDPFSFTMNGEPWRTQSWLAELLYSQVDSLVGLSGTPLITTVCSAVVFVLLGLVAYRRSRSVISVVVFLVATAMVIAAFINPRPVIFSFPLFAAVVLADDDRRLRWALPGLMWIWAAVHGSFFIGLLYLGLLAIGRGLTRRRFVELLCIGVPTLFTAHGFGILQILRDFATNRDAIDLMSEWATPDLLSPPFIPLLLGILALIWLAQRGKLKGVDWLLFVPFLLIALSANRSVPPAWIALSPILSRLAIPVKPSRTGGPIVIALAVLLAVFPFFLPRDEDIDTARFPLEAAEHLTADRVFHDDAVGGWLIYSQWPDRLVYIDDRAELYGEQMVRFTEVRGAGREWRGEFEEWSIDQVLLPINQPLVETLRTDGWLEQYADENFVILGRPGVQ